MTLRLCSALLLLAFVGCASPHVVPTSQDTNFQLAMLKTQQVAMLPIATADLDESSTKTVGEEYKGKDKFLDAFSNAFSSRLVGVCKIPSLDSEKMLSLLLASDATKPLLDPAKLLGPQDPNNRFAEGTSPAGLTTLSQLPEMKNIKYLVVARDLIIGRQWSTQTNAGGGFVSTGPGGGTFMGASSSSSAKTSARLRLAIVDLETRTIVWDGAIFADASSTFMKATALHEIEGDLAAHFINEIIGTR